nr:anaphase-promoting complex subunit 6 [Ipomoea batatas]GMD48361.1 anaphase-promoting complex subunit 6 [Ipomoea batatas]
MWEPTIVNLAHALRKLKFTMLTLSLTQEKFSAAITYYHKALWLKPDDKFCTEMLTLALADECRYGSIPRIESHHNELLI